jgi:hypothetical protein
LVKLAPQRLHQVLTDHVAVLGWHQPAESSIDHQVGHLVPALGPISAMKLPAHLVRRDSGDGAQTLREAVRGRAVRLVGVDVRWPDHARHRAIHADVVDDGIDIAVRPGLCESFLQRPVGRIADRVRAGTGGIAQVAGQVCGLVRHREDRVAHPDVVVRLHRPAGVGVAHGFQDVLRAHRHAAVVVGTAQVRGIGLFVEPAVPARARAGALLHRGDDAADPDVLRGARWDLRIQLVGHSSYPAALRRSSISRASELFIRMIAPAS